MFATAAAVERRAAVFNPLNPQDPALAEMFDNYISSSGENVTATTAQYEEAVLAAGRYICETVAALPWYLEEELQPRGYRRASEHWLDSRLHRRPNYYQTAFDFKNLIMNWFLFRGNITVLIQPSTRMAPFELWPLHPDRMIPLEINGERFYDYMTPTNGVKRLRWGEVFHVPFMPNDGLPVIINGAQASVQYGWWGKSIIAYARDTIGRAMATERFAGAYFRNKTNLGGVLKSKRKMSKEAKKQLAEDWRDAHSGPDNSGRVAVLEEDLDWTPVQISNVDSQTLDFMKMNTISVARIFRVPPHKIGALEEAKWANIEQEQINAVLDCIQPLCVRLEQRANLHLLTDPEQRKYTAKFNLNMLMQGSFLERQQGRAIQRQNGILDGNDWADSEHMNPFDGGELRFVPLNWTEIQQAGVSTEPVDPAPLIVGGAGPDAGDRTAPLAERRSLEMMRRLRSSYTPLLEDGFRRILRREADNVERQFRRQAQDRSLSDFMTWCDNYYAEQRDSISQTMTPLMTGYCELVGADAAQMVSGEPPDLASFVASYAGALTARHIAASRAAVQSLITDGAGPEEMLSRLDAMTDDWRHDRAGRSALGEAVRAANAVSVAVWSEAGVRQVRWMRSNDCPDCEVFAGKVVDIRGEFGPQMQHPPLITCRHGCQCSIVPA